MILVMIVRRLLLAAALVTGTLTVSGQLVVREQGPTCGNAEILEDYHGAPMWWVNCYGAQSGAEPVCAMGFHLEPVACLGGPYGEYGVKPEVVLYRNGKIWRVVR